MSIRSSIEGAVESSKTIVWDASNVYKIREAIYERKVQIIKTPLIRDIYHAVCNDINHPPINIAVSKSGIFARQYDPASNTYNPMNIQVYYPQYEFDYVLACAICLIIQDIYPNTYDMPNSTMNELVFDLNSGIWSVTLTMKKELTGIMLNPTFNIDNIADVPLESLPIQTEDSYSKKYNVLPVISVILGLLAVVVCFTKFALLTTFPAIIGIILAVISKNTVNKNKLWVVGLIVSIVGLVLPFLIMFGIL